MNKINQKIRIIKMICVLAFYCFAAQPLFAQEKNPAISRFNPIISFYASFDEDTLLADMSTASNLALSKVAPVFAKGRYGRALVVSKYPVKYDQQGNVDLLKPGAVSCWIAPQNWIKRDEALTRPYLPFFLFRLNEGIILIERQGFSYREDGSLLRKEWLLFVGQITGMKTSLVVTDSTLLWQPEEWHLMVMNWNRNGAAVSLDGGKTQRKDFPRPLTENDFASGSSKLYMDLGYRHTETTLLDEFTIYNRNLSADEITYLYKGETSK